MADLILTDILNSRISVKEIMSWLITDQVEDKQWAELNNAGCTRNEFVLHFLNFLRDQTASIRTAPINARQTPAKATLSRVSSIEDKHDKTERNHRRVSLFHAPENQTPEPKNSSHGVRNITDSQTQAENRYSTSLPETDGETFRKKIASSPADKNNESPSFVNSQDVAKTQDMSNTVPDSKKDTLNVKNNFSRLFDISPDTTTSTPVPKKRVSLTSVPRTPGGSNDNTHSFSTSDNKTDFSQNNTSKIMNEIEFDSSGKSLLSDTVNDSFLNHSLDVRNANTHSNMSNSASIISKNTSSVFNHFSESKGQSSPLNTSLESKNSGNNEFNESSFWNTSRRSKLSAKNETHSLNTSLLLNEFQQCPVSPLYVNNVTTTMHNPKKLYSRSAEKSQNSNNNSRQNANGTPKQGVNSAQKNFKSTPRQNVSLADFITVDTRGSKKGSGKKSNAKTQMLRNSGGESQLAKKLSVTDESFPQVGKNSTRRRRRIKPTRLDVSDDKGSEESATFGVISRPPVINPQFLENLSTDKSSDKTSFEAERDLLRLERQKQQKVFPSIESDDHPVQSLLTKTSSKPKLSGRNVTPDVSYVENKEALTILAIVYSGLFDYNLILNLMTELYFVLSLINLQHPLENDKLPSNGNSSLGRYTTNEKSVNNERIVRNDKNPNNLEEHAEPTKLDNYNEDLGCAILTDEVDSEIDIQIPLTNNNKAHLQQMKENLGNLTLRDKENNCETIHPENLNRIVYNIEMEYFQTIHNCVYFSTCILNNQRGLLKLLNRATLKLLCENSRIAAFLPELQEYLNELYKVKLNESTRLKQQYNVFSAAETNVCFQIDTDNRENFPSLSAFQSFRKQRDLFYEVLRIWEHNHLREGWVFSISLAGKIRTLLTLHNDATNYSHFARLFKSQLLISCIGNGPQEDPMDDDSLSFLKSLKHLNPEKLTRLRERLVTPLSARGPVPPPSFPGVQEFYKDFILHASNPMFHAHLQDCLVHEIMEMNDTNFTGSEIEDTETMVDEETKQNFITCLSSLRLLAKFLGFLISLPYRCELNSLESVIASQIELRIRVQPPLNLQSCLQNAMINGKLSLTIPWTVKYLAMLDPVALRLPYYKAIMELLFHIYRESNHCISKFDNLLAMQTAVLIKFCLGWLFEQPNFPEGLYFNWRSSQTNKKLEAICHFDDQSPQNCSAASIEATTRANSSIKFSPCLDSLDIVDDRVLYVCCPFLTELKILLMTDNSSLSNSSSIRHITPVSSGLDRPIGGTSAKQLELQLEEAFFHGQPASTRKTVDFVSERVASSCVKHVCNTLLPSAREKNANAFRDIVTNQILPDDINKFKSSMFKEMHSIGSKVAEDSRRQCVVQIPPMCKSRTINAMESLLAEDALPSVKQICAQIAIRMATERINHWIQSHIVGLLFVRDMETEIDKVYKSKAVPKDFEKRLHNPEAACPTDVIIEIRSLYWELLDNRGRSLTIQTVLQTLDKLYQSLTERADLLPGPEKVLCSMSVDFALFLAAHRTDLFVPETHGKLMKIWKIKYLNFSEPDSILSRLLSPRNIMLLAQPENDAVWPSLGQLLKGMLKEGVLTIEVLCDQCTALFRHDWPIPILKHLSNCVTEGIEDYKSSSEKAERIKLLLNWIAEVCNEMEFD